MKKDLLTRQEKFKTLFPGEPSFRFKQIERAFFDIKIHDWDSISTIPKGMRQKLAGKLEWMSLKLVKILESKSKDTYKALLQTLDDKKIESVLMKNARDEWTICVSSQIGCPISCVFCATGSMGFKRNLLCDEIIDQYRFWNYFLEERKLYGRISNIVFMGMGEPLLNFENIKEAIWMFIKVCNIGPTKIVVSTVGIFPEIEKILSDKNWPPIRIAISLHSSSFLTRKKLIPKTPPDFFSKIIDWSKEYIKIHGNRRHYLTFEYLLLGGVNDSDEDAQNFSKIILKIGLNKVNLIPYNPLPQKKLTRGQTENIKNFKSILRSYNIDVTERRSMGGDITAACGQLSA